MRISEKLSRGAVAVGLSVLTLGAWTSPASAQEPTAAFKCHFDGTRQSLSISVTDLPVSGALRAFVILQYSGFNTVLNGYPLLVGSDGSGVVDFSGSLPQHVDFVAYSNTGDVGWNPDEDKTFYRGEGTPPGGCPSSLALSPK